MTSSTAAPRGGGGLEGSRRRLAHSKPDALSSAGEGRWLARLLLAGISPGWPSFSNRELTMAEATLDAERAQLAKRGVECRSAAVALARVEIARERNRRLHST
jgi:hypothetical protein